MNKSHQYKCHEDVDGHKRISHLKPGIFYITEEKFKRVKRRNKCFLFFVFLFFLQKHADTEINTIFKSSLASFVVCKLLSRSNDRHRIYTAYIGWRYPYPLLHTSINAFAYSLLCIAVCQCLSMSFSQQIITHLRNNFRKDRFRIACLVSS